ncbi:hypothetical protein GCM10023405_08740 [Streptomonospora salina]
MSAALIGVPACSAGDDAARPAAGSPSAVESERGGSDPAPAESAPPEAGPQSGGEPGPRGRAAPSEEGAPPGSAPPLDAFAGLSGNDGVFAMHVDEAYVDDDGVITDGAGTTDRAAEGSEYVVVNVRITNESSAPAYFDWGGSYAYDADGNQYADDADAAWAACDTYCSDDLNPGGSAETDVVFEMPEGTGIVSLELRSAPYGSGGAAIIEP